MKKTVTLIVAIAFYSLAGVVQASDDQPTQPPGVEKVCVKVVDSTGKLLNCCTQGVGGIAACKLVGGAVPKPTKPDDKPTQPPGVEKVCVKIVNSTGQLLDCCQGLVGIAACKLVGGAVPDGCPPGFHQEFHDGWVCVPDGDLN